ncbi:MULTISPECIES: hypothetical protein [Halomonadaceae]|uniref:hypothetical protein n=1 Tax=Halomonadaceae TaxID=28256 RepID=UPI001599A8C8|nr:MULTISPECIES: hypothetical protein [Halomonas]QJQ96906.1 hypothetical protein HIO72_17535 [Halomonas sp. PA5]
MTTRLWEELLFIVLLAGVITAALIISADYPFTARLMPQVVAIATLGLIAIEAVLTFRRLRRANDSAEALEPVYGAKFRRTMPYFLWLGGLYAGIALIGLMASVALFTFAFCRFVGKMSWLATLIGALVLIAMLFGLSDAFNLRWPVGYLFDPFR